MALCALPQCGQSVSRICMFTPSHVQCPPAAGASGSQQEDHASANTDRHMGLRALDMTLPANNKGTSVSCTSGNRRTRPLQRSCGKQDILSEPLSYSPSNPLRQRVIMSDLALQGVPLLPAMPHIPFPSLSCGTCTTSREYDRPQRASPSEHPF